MASMINILAGKLGSWDEIGMHSAPQCTEALLPNGHIHVSTNSCGTFKFRDTVQTTSDSCLMGESPSPDAYFYLAATLEELIQLFFSTSCNQKRFYPTVWAVVFICAAVDPDTSYSLALEAYRIMWRFSAYNSALMIGQNTVYRADPFAKSNRCGKELQELYISNCSHHADFTDRNHFPNCSFLVSIRDSYPFSMLTSNGTYIGSDVKLTELIAYSSGLNIKWIERPSPQTALSADMIHAYYYNITRNEIDLAIGGSILSYQYVYNVTYGFSHTSQYLKFFVSDCEVIKGYERFTEMFTLELWGLIIFSMCLSILALFAFGDKDISQYFLMVVGMLLQMATVPPTRKQRFMFIIIILSFFWINFTYITYLHSYILNPPKYCDINDIGDIVKRNLTVLLSHTNKKVIDNVQVPIVRMALRNTKISVGLKWSSKLLHDKKIHVLIERDLAVQYLVNQQRFNIHSLPYKLSTLQVGLVYPKGSVFKKRINSIIKRCVESGLCDKWILESLGNPYKKIYRLRNRPIFMSDIGSAFIILAIGFTTAIITFMLEIIFGLFSRKNRKKKIGEGGVIFQS